MEWSKIVASKAKSKDLSLVTHAVPARRLRRLLPEKVVLETFSDADSGEEIGFITACAGKNTHFRPAAFGAVKMSFSYVAYRTYALFKGIPSLFYFGSDMSTWPSFALQRANAMETEKGEIMIAANRDAYGGYDLYRCDADSGHGHLSFELRGKKRPNAKAPFATGEDKAKFFHNRFHCLLQTSAGGLGDQVVEHTPMKGREGELLNFECDYWTRLGLLKEDEAISRFYNALIFPSGEYLYYPVVPSALMPRSA